MVKYESISISGLTAGREVQFQTRPPGGANAPRSSAEWEAVRSGQTRQRASSPPGLMDPSTRIISAAVLGGARFRRLPHPSA